MSLVLVVDDSAVVRAMLAEELLQRGYDVILAIDGLDAMTLMQASPPDLVITDVVMPRMNGYELCRWIKNDLELCSIPVVMCSTKSEAFDRYWGLKQGADAYVTKPCSPNDLDRAVRRLLMQTVPV